MKRNKFLLSLVMLFVAIFGVAFFGCDKAQEPNYTYTLQVSGNEDKTYYIDTEFSIDGYTLKLKNDTTEELITINLSNVEVELPDDMETPGEKTIKITYQGVEYTFTIVVHEYTYSLKVTAQEEIDYYVGDEFDMNDYTIELENDVTKARETIALADVEVIMPDMTTAGEKEVTVLYQDYEFTFTIEVKVYTYTLKVSANDEEIDYYVGDEFDMNDYTIELENDVTKARETIALADVEVIMPDMTTAGEKEVTVLYQDYEFTFTIDVMPYTYTLDVTGNEDAVYCLGDEFSMTGYNLKLTNDITGEETNLALSDVFVKMPNMSTSGEKEIEITYDGETYSFSIWVESYTRKYMEISEKLSDFLSYYMENKASSDLKITLSSDLIGSFLGDEGGKAWSKTLFDSSKEGFDGDRLYDFLYDAVVSSIVSGSVFVDQDAIENSVDYKFDFNYVLALLSFLGQAQQFDYYDYFINDVAFPGPKDMYVKTVADFLGANLWIDGDEGYNTLYSLVENNFDKIKGGEEVDFEGVLDSLFEIINNYSLRSEIKDITGLAYDLAYGDFEHKISDLIEFNLKETLILHVAEYGDFRDLTPFTNILYYDADFYDIPEEIIDAFDSYIGGIKNLAMVFENALLSDEEIDYDVFLAEVSNACKQIVNTNQGLGADYLFYLEGSCISNNMFFEVTSQFIDCYLDNKEGFLIDFLRQYGYDKMIVDLILNKAILCGVSQEGVQAITDLAWSFAFENSNQILIKNDIKQVLVSVAGMGDEEADMYVDFAFEVLNNPNDHLISKMYKEMVKDSFVVRNAEYEVVDTPEAEAYLERFATIEGEMVRTIEDLILNTINEKSLNFDAFLDDMKGTVDAIVELYGDMGSLYVSPKVGGTTVAFDQYYGVAYYILYSYREPALALGLAIEFHAVEFVINYVDATVAMLIDGEKALDNDTVMYISQMVYGLAGSIIDGTYSQFISDNGLIEMATYFIPMPIADEDRSYIVSFFKDLIDGKDVDYVGFVFDFARILGVCSEEEVAGYVEFFNQFGYTTIVSDVLKRYYDVNEPNGKAIIDFAEYVEKIVVDGVDYYKLTGLALRATMAWSDQGSYLYMLSDLANSILNDDLIDFARRYQLVEMLLYYCGSNDYESFPVIADLIYNAFTNDGFDYISVLDGLTRHYSSGIAYTLSTGLATDILGFAPDSEGFVAVKDLLQQLVEDALDGNFDYVTAFSNFNNIVDNYCDEATKPYVRAICTMILVMLNGQVNIDYNEIFSFVELPEFIESIDYNKLIPALTEGQTFENVFEVGDVATQFVLDSAGNIVGEVLCIVLHVDFDIAVSNLSGDIVLNFELNF